MKLTDLKIRKTQPEKKRFEISDGDGLALRVMPSGAKSWIYRYRHAGNARRMTLGTYPGLTLAIARERHQEAVACLQRGDDPAVKRDTAPTFKTAWDEFLKLELKKTSSGKARARLVEKDALPYWEKRKMADITRRDAVLLLRRVRTRAPVTANRLQSVLTRMFNFSAEEGLIEDSPMLGMRRTKEKPRERVLTVDEIKNLWSALDIANDAFNMSIAARSVLKMILLTGQRPGEVSGMTWDEIDTDKAEWNIPAERMKGREPHKVPLCPMAMVILDQARFYLSGSEFVFQSGKKPGNPIIRQSVTRAVNESWKTLGGVEPFTPHDLRRTVRTMLAELKVDDIVAEKVMGHKLAGMLKVYNKYSYDKERRQALAKWENKLAKIIGQDTGEGGKVISFVNRR